MRRFPSFEAARHVFDEYAALEPRLAELWSRCRRAAPSLRANEDVDDAFDRDTYDFDTTASSDSTDGWCAEDFFSLEIKSPLMLLVGWYRPREPQELRSSKAYDEVYSALFNFALNRTCVCCRESLETCDDGMPLYG
jgi:hypothetical protein